MRIDFGGQQSVVKCHDRIAIEIIDDRAKGKTQPVITKGTYLWKTNRTRPAEMLMWS